MKQNMNFQIIQKKITPEYDASDIGIVLRQDDRIIGYYSKKLRGP